MHIVVETGGVLVGYAYHVIMALIFKCANLNGKSSILTVGQLGWPLLGRVPLCHVVSRGLWAAYAVWGHLATLVGPDDSSFSGAQCVCLFSS